MKQVRILLAAALLSLGATSVQAQSLKDILSGVAKAVVGNKATSESSIIGTWKYEGPDCEFESDDLLGKIGGSAATSKINSKLETYFTKFGLTSSSTITFNEDKTFTTKLKSKTVSGTYTFDSSDKKVTLKSAAGTSVAAYVTTSGSSMSLLFEASKLMTGIKTISNYASKLNSTASLVNKLLGSYDGMKVGVKLSK